MEAFEKKTEVEKIRERNGKLVDNILPKHVADYFLQNQNKDETVIFPYFTPSILLRAFCAKCK